MSTNEYTEAERDERINEWQEFFADPDTDPDEFIDRAGQWDNCAVGTLARDRDIVRACYAHTAESGKIRAAGGNDADVYADAPPLFVLGCKFEAAMLAFEEARCHEDTDAERNELEHARELFDKIRDYTDGRE
jgi:hypothetical protein